MSDKNIGKIGAGFMTGRVFAGVVPKHECAGCGVSNPVNCLCKTIVDDFMNNLPATGKPITLDEPVQKEPVYLGPTIGTRTDRFMNDNAPKKVGTYQKLGTAIGSLTDRKNAAYGNSFNECADFLGLMYPNGVTPDQYTDMLCLVRIFDKLKRIATKKDAFGESPYNDIAGYALLGIQKDIEKERANAPKGGMRSMTELEQETHRLFDADYSMKLAKNLEESGSELMKIYGRDATKQAGPVPSSEQFSISHVFNPASKQDKVPFKG